MKRTKNINQESFRKSWRSYRLAPVALAVSAVLTLSSCEKSDETVSLYQNVDECSLANPNLKEQCNNAYQQAVIEANKTAPKYAAKADCAAEFGQDKCIDVPAEQAGLSSEPRAGSVWMPLMAGYMFGRMMSGSYASTPLFTSSAAGSPARGNFVDANGRSYGSATTGRSVNVNKRALAPKPATTSTITRGGFGQTVMKQNSMQRNSTSGTRSTGG